MTTARTVPSPIIDATFTDGCSVSIADQRSAKRSNDRAVSSAVPAGFARRARRPVLTDDDRRDALSNQRLGARILPQRAVAVRVDVDEPRRDGEAARVDLDGAALRQPFADVQRCVPFDDRDVELAAGAAESVEHGAVADDDVGVARGSAGAAPARRRRRRPRWWSSGGSRDVWS